MQVDISQLGVLTGQIMGIGELAGGVLCVFALYSVTTAIMGYWLKGSEAINTMVLVNGLLCTALGTALGWVDLWLPILAVLVMIFIISVKGSGGLGGK